MRISDWSSDVCAADLVDPRGAALQVLGDLRRSLDVGAPHRAGQPVVGGVGPLDDLVDVAVGDDGQRWTELLLVDDPGAVGEAGQDGWLEEVAVAFHRLRSEEHTSELQSLMRISYAVFCLNKKKNI